MNGVMAAWAVEVGVIAVRDMAKVRRFPLPSELLATFIVFGGLGVVAGNATARKPAVTVAWGLVLATLIVDYAPLSEGGLASQLLTPVGDLLAGKDPGAVQAPTIVGAAPSARGQTNQGGSILNSQKGF